MAISADPPLSRNSTAANLFRTTMNKVFKKKAFEPQAADDETVNAFLTGSGTARSSSPPPPPPPPPHQPLKKSASRWKRSKKPIEPRREYNLNLTLPSNDDLRCSLFMPAMTARFSLLREQYDPNSILGKASDDSVLQPRRQSRMDFGIAKGGLDDIAEVSSIKSAKSSVRPPFADVRQASFASEDSYHSESESSRNASVINRSRPGEGNTLFGGRQKVYVIPKTGSGAARTSGRTLYEDDVGISSLQKPKPEPETEESWQPSEINGFDFGLDQIARGEDDEHDEANTSKSSNELSHSPSQSSSENKWSTRSTHSEARSSTAATSIASQPATATTSPTKATPQPAPAPVATTAPPPPVMQPAKRVDTKGRRLYEQGLDQHMQEQQTSALTRLNSIQRQHTLSNKTPPMYLHSAKSASNINEKARQPVFALPEQNSPMMARSFSPFASNGLAGSNGATPLSSAPGSPLPPHHGPDIEENNALSQALEPADRGKATAMGAFNKPQRAFDEQQYLERQRQLQRSASTNGTKKVVVTPPAPKKNSNTILEEEEPEEDEYDESRSRSLSNTEQHAPTNAYNVFQKAAQLNSQADTGKANNEALPDTHRTFFGNISGGDSDDEHDAHQTQEPTFRMPDYGYGTHHGKWQPTILPAVLEHPALRNTSSKPSLGEEEKAVKLRPVQNMSRLGPSQAETPKINTPADGGGSRMLGVEERAEALRRSRLVRHLREGSDVSSTTQNTDRTSTAEVTEQLALTSQNSAPAETLAQSTVSSDSRVVSCANSNPWDLDDAESTTPAVERASYASISPIDSEQHVCPFESRLSTFKNRESAVSELGLEEGQKSSRQSNTQRQHTRDASTATQQDREALDNELAARASAIQESIKSKLERENQSRGISPARSASGGFKGFGMLKSRPSRESVEASSISEIPSNALPKALKILGSHGVASPNASSTTLNSQYESGGHSTTNGRSRDDSISRPPVPNIDPRVMRHSEQDAKAPVQQLRSRENSEIDASPLVSRSPPSPAGGRSRTDSMATSGRSRSRTGPYRDDLEKAMVEGTGTSTAVVPDLATNGPRELTPRSTPEINQSPFDPPRARSGSRGGMTNYFDAKSLNPIMTGSRERLTPNVPSPALTPNPYSPMLSPSPLSPAGSFAHAMTPPLSGASTPLQSTFTPPSSIPLPSNNRQGGILRKKTISKGDISEPTLISATSSIDLVDLPEGASLKNGMDEPPPLPPMNPARRATRRILSFGRKESPDGTTSHGGRSKTPDSHSRRQPEVDLPFDLAHVANRARSDTLSPQKPSSKRSMDDIHSVQRNGSISHPGSPEQVERPPVPPVPVSIAMEGAMF